MSVTITIAELVAALRLSDSPEELAEATRLLAYATEAVTQHVPTAPDAVHDESVRRLAGYLYDQPEASRGDAYSNAMRNSGASRMLLPYRIHRAGYSDAVEAAQAAVGTTGNPVTDVSVTGSELVVTFADGSSETHTLPAGGGMGGVDQTARDGATNAQNAADAAQGEIDAHETSEHNTDSTARGAAAQTQTELDTHEASTHNTDSVARSTAVNARQVGESAQTTADTARTDLTAHEATPHGGGTDQTARDAAAAAQADVDAHEASTHNTDAGARTGAANAQTFAQEHAASTHNTDTTARAAATAAQADIDAHEANHPGGGATPPTVLYESATANITTNTTLITGNIVCPETGMLECYFEQTAGDRQGSIAMARIPAARVRAAVSALAVGYNNDNANVRIIPLGANRGVSISVQATTFYLMLNAQSAGTFVARIAHEA